MANDILDVPQFSLKSSIDDSFDPKTNVPEIGVRFANGIEDVIKLEHITIMPNSKKIDSLKLCNYMGSIKNEEKKSVDAVTGSLNRNKLYSKSGSPDTIETIRMPFDFNCLALSLTAIVADGLTF